MDSNTPKETSNLANNTKKPNKLNDLLVFVKAWVSSPLRTGANAPSSRFLARAMVAAADANDQTKIIELGPGTGVFTKALLDSGVKPENLTLIELNPEFRKLLHGRYPKVTILDEDAFDYIAKLAKEDSGQNYTIISGLPLLVFPKETRIKLREDMLKVVGHTNKIVQFTYGLKSPIPLDETVHAHNSSRVWLNSPPAVVWTYTNPKT